MKILVTGSDGLIGKNILPALREEFEVIPFVESQWDITDRKRGEEIIRRVGPDVLINLAAITDVDGCEDREELAFRVNGEGAGILATICAGQGVDMVHFSTDYVFDGRKKSPYTEEDPTNPLSVYGKSKLLGEQKVISNHPGSLIVRTEWIYGDGGESFVTKVVKAVRDRGTVDVVNDQTGTPTYAKDLARPVAALTKNGSRGIYHVTNEGSCTWHGFASLVFSFLGLDVVCRPITSDRLTRKAVRPSYSVLDCGKMRTDANLRMRSWQEAAEEYLRRNESDLLFGRTPRP